MFMVCLDLERCFLGNAVAGVGDDSRRREGGCMGSPTPKHHITTKNFCDGAVT